MKWPFIFLNLCFSLFQISCLQKKKKQPEIISPTQKSEKKVSIASIGGIQFAKSYSEIQSMTDEKQIRRYIEKVDKSNPYYLASKSDSILKPLFQNLGIVKGDELLLSKFKYSSKPDTIIKNFWGKEIRFHLQKDTTGNNHDRIIVFYDRDSSETRPVFHQKIEYAFLDVIPGGKSLLF